MQRTRGSWNPESPIKVSKSFGNWSVLSIYSDALEAPFTFVYRKTRSSWDKRGESLSSFKIEYLRYSIRPNLEQQPMPVPLQLRIA